MSTDPRTPSDRASDVTPDRDVLLTRVMDGRASADEWDAFRDLASRDPSAWSDLQAMQRDHEQLSGQVDLAIARAELTPLPDPETTGLAGHTHRFERRASGVAKWLGWGVAAMVAISWMIGSSGGPVTMLPPTETNTAGVGPAMPWGEGTGAALDYYLTHGREQGRVVRELPDRPVLQTIAQEDGSVEVLYLRQIVERAVVDDLYRVTQDDLGNPVPVSVPAQAVPTRRPPL